MNVSVTSAFRFCSSWSSISTRNCTMRVRNFLGEPLARIIALVNQKGGVGKSTTAVNLGAALAILGKRILVIDADPQGNTTTGFGVDKSALHRDVYDVLLQETSIPNVVVRTEIESLALVPATINLAGAEIELVLGAFARNAPAPSEIATRSPPQYDFVFIDLPAVVGIADDQRA